MKRYGISKFLTDAEQRAIVSARYEPTEHGFWRAEGGYCPLGIALRNRDPNLSPSPGEEEVIWAMGGPPDYFWEDRRKWMRIERAAARFISDWDGRKITPADLPAIFGVEGR